MVHRSVALTILAAGLLVAATGGGWPAGAQTSLHLVLTPSQKPTDLIVAGEAFGAALGKLVGVPDPRHGRLGLRGGRRGAAEQDG